MTLTLPQILYGITHSKTGSSFGEQIVTLQTVSILTSFLAMAKSYHRIRNLSKKNALTGKSGLAIFSLTTLGTMSRILSFGIFLYSLSSTYSYNNFNYAKLLRQEDDPKLHQPSLIKPNNAIKSPQRHDYHTKST